MSKKEESVKGNILTNSFWNFIALIISKIGALVLTIVLARNLMPEGFGNYSIVFAMAMLFLTVGDLGLNYALIRYVSFYLKKDKRKVGAYHNYLFKIKTRLMSLFSLLFAASAYPLAKYAFQNEALTVPFLVAAAYIFVLAFDNFYAYLFYAMEKVHYFSIREAVNQILRVIFVLAIFYIFSTERNIESIFASFIVISLILLFFSIMVLRRKMPELWVKSSVKINERKVLRFIGFLTIATVSGVFFSHVDALMLGFMISSEMVGYYKAAFALVFGLAGFLAFPNAVLFVAFNKMNKKQASIVLSKALRFISLITIPSTFGILLLSRFAIKILYGETYLPSSLALSWLSFLLFPMVSTGVLLSLFSANEKTETLAKLTIITIGINILLNLVLITSFSRISPVWASAGAALATVLSWIFYFLASIFYLKGDVNINVGRIPIVKPLIAGASMFLILYYIKSRILDLNVVLGLSLILLGILIYFVLLYIMKGLTKEDIVPLRILAKKLSRK